MIIYLNRLKLLTSNVLCIKLKTVYLINYLINKINIKYISLFIKLIDNSIYKIGSLGLINKSA